MSIEFLGNKRQLEDFILANIESHIEEECHSCIDVFSGSGSVSAALKRRGYDVIANDFLYFSTILTKAILENDEPPEFSNIIQMIDTSESTLSPYGRVLEYLNTLEGKEGFIYNNYSPASKFKGNVERMYFTEDNAKKIDAIRMQIDDWKELLTENEFALLLSDLIKAVGTVSNIAGTYGCYMKYWKAKAITPIKLSESPFINGAIGARHATYNEDANRIVELLEADIIYADPPYTKRQYSAYYHILETIALYDSPKLMGKTGLRNWKEKSSDYCYKRKAPHALEDLVSKAKCKYFILSYNSESQIPHEKVIEILSKKGHVVICETPYRRYKSNSVESKRGELVERLYIVKMECKKDDIA